MRRLPLLVLVLASTTLAGCGNAVTAKVAGAVGVGVDPAGHVVAFVATCGHDLDTVTLVGGREGLPEDQPNPVIGHGRIPEDAEEITEIQLAAGTDGDQTSRPLTVDDLAGSTLYVLSARSSQHDLEAPQVSFDGEDLVGLSGRMVVGDREVRDRDELAAACDAAG